MKPSDLVELLREFYAAKLRLKMRHEASARQVGQYDFNNTYQYVINREEGHIDWLRRAITALGGTLPDPQIHADSRGPENRQGATLPDPQIHADSRGPENRQGAEGEAAIIEQDARRAQDFLDEWRPRVEQVSDSRQRLMLGVILGEMVEHQRFFDQARAGRTDLLGRRTSPSKASGTVLGTRWVE